MNFNDEFTQRGFSRSKLHEKLSFNNKDIEIYNYIIKNKLLSFFIYLYMYFIKLLRPF